MPLPVFIATPYGALPPTLVEQLCTADRVVIAQSVAARSVWRDLPATDAQPARRALFTEHTVQLQRSVWAADRVLPPAEGFVDPQISVWVAGGTHHQVRETDGQRVTLTQQHTTTDASGAQLAADTRYVLGLQADGALGWVSHGVWPWPAEADGPLPPAEMLHAEARGLQQTYCSGRPPQLQLRKNGKGATYRPARSRKGGK